MRCQVLVVSPTPNRQTDTARRSRPSSALKRTPRKPAMPHSHARVAVAPQLCEVSSLRGREVVAAGRVDTTAEHEDDEGAVDRELRLGPGQQPRVGVVVRMRENVRPAAAANVKVLGPHGGAA
mmetsp:Transcript_91177/g.260394  ORF Transcript_91177/g.260394 Transcript_91177/m.260394 type:complete len:123 (+) Transcript_91177:71-439(+)